VSTSSFTEQLFDSSSFVGRHNGGLVF